MKLSKTVLSVGAGFSAASDIRTTEEVGKQFLNFSSYKNTHPPIQNWITTPRSLL